MNSKLAQLYRQARALHTSVVALSADVDSLVKSSADMREEADIAYALRESAKFLDDARKRLDKHASLAMRMACLIYTAEMSSGPIRTDHCIATPDIKTICAIPRRSADPEGFARLMQYLGVPDHCYDGEEHSAVQPHWPGLVELLNKRLSEGKTLPEGIDPNKTWPDYKLIIRGRIAPDGEGPVSAEREIVRDKEEAPF